MWRPRLAALGAALVLVPSGCASDRSLDAWDSPQSLRGALVATGPVRTPEVEPRTTALDASSRVAITVPQVYRVRLDGTVGADGLTTDFSVGGWLLAVAPYPSTGPAVNDVNVVDLGLVTDTSPLEARPGAVWFGTHTSVMAQLDLGGVTPNAGPVDLVEETADGDLLAVRVLPELAAANPLNLFAVDAGGALGAVREGALQLRFSADATTLVGQLDVVDPASGATYHAELSGRDPG